MPGFSVGSIHKVLASNGGLLSLNCPLWDTIQFQTEAKYPHWTGHGVTVTPTLTEDNFPSAFTGSSRQLCGGGRYCPHFLDGQTEGQSGN